MESSKCIEQPLDWITGTGIRKLEHLGPRAAFGDHEYSMHSCFVDAMFEIVRGGICRFFVIAGAYRMRSEGKLAYETIGEFFDMIDSFGVFPCQRLGGRIRDILTTRNVSHPADLSC
ncbi:hypothetical protein FRC03_008268 [Tulasnella sp. 419]|nr:hypothetical protein FRC03_008268 [Tulasnella sp. 419]